MMQPSKQQIPTLRERISGEVLALMGRHRVTQTTLAAYLGMKQSSLSDRLKCMTPWRVDELEAIAAYFDVPVTKLLGDDPIISCSSRADHLTSLNDPFLAPTLPWDEPAADYQPELALVAAT